MDHYFTDDGELIMVMGGLPGWVFGLAIGAVIILSFVAVEWRGLATPSGWRLNLTASPRWHRLVRRRGFQFAFQAPILAIFLFTVYAGLFGSYARNITPVLVWTVWWGALIFAVALSGNAFCFACPWDAMANLFSRLSFWRRREGISLGLAPPKWLRSVYPAIGLFVLLTWAELGFGVTQNPRQTAYMALFMVAAAVVFALLFERKVFCSSVCLVGRVSGMYSNFAPVEIRPRDLRVCGVCTTRDCLTGNARGYACPTGLDLGELSDNTYCTQCTECFKSCRALAPAIQIRPPGSDLHKVERQRMDEAWLALVLLALTAFHGLSMTPMWEDFAPGTTDLISRLRTDLGLSRLVAFTAGMAGVMAAPLGVYALACAAAARWVKHTGVGFRTLFISYAWSVLPVALFYHMAHNAMHLFMEGQKLLPLLSDPLGRGSDWFGTAKMVPDAILGQESVWAIQVALVVTGHLFGVTVSHRIGRRLFPDKRDATKSLVPMLVMMVALSVGGLWLMHLDMNMRTGRM